MGLFCSICIVIFSLKREILAQAQVCSVFGGFSLPESRSSEVLSLKRELGRVVCFGCSENVAQAWESRSSEALSLKREPLAQARVFWAVLEVSWAITPRGGIGWPGKAV